MTNSWPAITLNWSSGGQLVNQRITPFVSLLNTCGTMMSAAIVQMIAKGMTCRGSSNGTTAALDGTNRCTTAAGWAVRAANTTTAQSWAVLTGSDGTQWLFSYTGGSDDIMRVAKSSQAGYVIAGTATFCPTATDEQVVQSGNTIIGATTSGDRVFDVFVDSTAKSWWFIAFQAGVPAGALVRGAPYDLGSPSFLVSPAAVLGPQTLGFVMTPSNYGQSSIGGQYSAAIGSVLRMTAPAGPQSLTCGGFVLNASNNATIDVGNPMALNGNVSLIKYCGIFSNNASGNGYIGWHQDMWLTFDPQACGALGGPTTGKEFVYLNNVATPANQSMLFPWDNATASCTTA